MKRSGIVVIGLVLVLLMGFSLIYAQDDDDLPEAGTAAENACNPGGSLYNTNGSGCPTAWHWKAGWYLAQVDNCELEEDDVPDDFSSVMSLAVPVSERGCDDSGDEVSIKGTPAENECYPGGILYRAQNQDGCPTMWYWKAGWYLAQFNQCELTRDDIPDEFKSVLPPISEDSDDDGEGCAAG